MNKDQIIQEIEVQATIAQINAERHLLVQDLKALFHPHGEDWCCQWEHGGEG